MSSHADDTSPEHPAASEERALAKEAFSGALINNVKVLQIGETLPVEVAELPKARGMLGSGETFSLFFSETGNVFFKAGEEPFYLLTRQELLYAFMECRRRLTGKTGLGLAPFRSWET